MTSPGGHIVGRVSVRVMPDTSRFRRELRSQLEKSIDPIKVKTQADTASVKDTARQIKNVFKQFGDMNIDIPMNKFEKALGNAVANAQRIRDGLVNATKSTVDLTKRVLNVKQHFLSTVSATKQLGSSIKNIRFNSIVTGTNRAATAFRKLGSAGGGALGALGKLASSALTGVTSGLSSMAEGAKGAISSLTSLSHPALIAVAAISALAPALGLIGGLLAGLPSLLMAAAAPIAAVTLGMDGIKKAFKGLEPQLKSLKTSLSNTFQKELAPVVNQLKTVFPVLEKGLTKVAVGLVNMGKGFTDVVTSAVGLQQIETILGKVGQFLGSLRPMITDATAGFLNLAAAGAQQFGVLADVLNKFGNQFNVITQRITSDGSFTSAIAGLAQVTDALLQGFLKLFEAGVRVMSQVAGPLTTFITAFVNALVAAMPILTAISNVILTALGGALQALTPLFTALGPPIALLGQMIGTLLTGAFQALIPVITPVANFLGTVLLAALKAIQPVIAPITTALTTLGTAVGTSLTQVFTALTPLLTMMAQAFGQILAAVTPLIPPLVQLVSTVLTALIGALTPIIPPLTQLASAVFPMLVAAVQAVIPVLMLIIQALAQILPPVIQFVGALLQGLIPAMQGLIGVVQTVWPAIQQIIQAAMTVIQGVINVVMGVITGDWSRAWEGIKQIFSGAWNLLMGAINAGIAAVKAIFTQLGPGIISALGNVGSLLLNAGKSIIQGLINGITSMAGAVYNAVQGVLAKARALLPFSPAKKGPFSGKGWTLFSGRSIMVGFAQGINQMGPNVVRALSGVMGQVNGAFASVRLEQGVRSMKANFDAIVYTVQKSVGAITNSLGGSLGDELARSIAAGTPAAIRSVDQMFKATRIQAEQTWKWHGQLEAGDMSSITDSITSALEGWGVDIDQNGVAKMVNKANNRRRRRR